MIITNPRTHKSSVVHNAIRCCCYSCTEIYGNEIIGYDNFRIFAQRQDCENNYQERFWNNVDLQKAQEQLCELILSFYLSGKYQFQYHSWIKVLEGSNQAPRSLLSNHIDHPVQGSNKAPRTLQSQDFDHPVQGSNQTPQTLHSQDVSHPVQGSNQVPRTSQSQHLNHPVQGSNKVPRTLQSHDFDHPVQGSNQTLPQTLQFWHVNHPVQGSNQAPRTLQSQDVDHPVQGSNRTAGTMNMNVWNRIQSTPIFAVFFGCFSRHRPVTRNKGSYNKYNRLTTAFSLKLICFVVQEKKIGRW